MYDAVEDPYCYPGTTVLKNRRNLRTQAALRRFETAITALRFRDGNGRAQLAFMALLADFAGHPLHLDRLKPGEFLAAMVKSFQGDERRLVEQFARLL